jgi:hypothetical protein
MGINPESIDDMELMPLIHKFNEFPFIQTIGACSGHNFWQLFEPDDHGGLKPWHSLGHSPYIQFETRDVRGFIFADYLIGHTRERIRARRVPHPQGYDNGHGVVQVDPQPFTLYPEMGMCGNGEFYLGTIYEKKLSELYRAVSTGAVKQSDAHTLVQAGMARFWNDISTTIDEFASEIAKR